MLHGFLPALLEGAVITLGVAGASLLIAVALGLVGAAAKLSRVPLIRWVATAYTTIVRGVPDLVLMLLIFYGGQLAVNASASALGYDDYIDIDPLIAGVSTIGFIFGAYLAETFRGALIAIPVGQREAGLALGMSHTNIFARITLPQMARLAIPGFTNNWLVLVKSTAIVSVIGLTDMMHRAGLAAGATREPFTFYLAAGVIYLLITTVSLLLLRAIEKRVTVGMRRAASGMTR
ncbi:ABC transporter [Betaproteobacteria bacterium UKL13-2]|jgi:arginine/ornithine transport system permease protein|nr:ABC transporter [Betaproteobacteria bacterium UKL13-2]HCG52329.1 arginine ABC transporter permease ArtQ [Betaproteobacteria bacterium]